MGRIIFYRKEAKPIEIAVADGSKRIITRNSGKINEKQAKPTETGKQQTKVTERKRKVGKYWEKRKGIKKCLNDWQN